MITQEQVANSFTYDGENLIWKSVSHDNKSYLIGSVAGSIHKTGYRHVTWHGKVHKTHRLIFLLVHGYLPEEVDHINGNRSDNRVSNLRSVSRSENQFNKIKQKNSSGCKGVSWHCKTKKWCVRVTKNAITKTIGYFDDLEFADLVAKEARSLLFGEFALENRSKFSAA